VTAIVGANACGKSALLRGLARLLVPTTGSVLIDGQDIARLPSRTVAPASACCRSSRRHPTVSPSPISSATAAIPTSDGFGSGPEPTSPLLTPPWRRQG
jgi:energy-coupling factor transporter ATP-binding protein EcfA2